MQVKGDQNAETSEKRASPSGDQGGEGSGAEGDEEYECPLCTFMKVTSQPITDLCRLSFPLSLELCNISFQVPIRHQMR